MAKSSSTSLDKGVKNDSPSNDGDSSRRLPKTPSVDSDATRTSVGRGHTLGPRNA